MEPEDVDNQMAIIAGLALKAMKGDSKAAKVLFDLVGVQEEAGNTSVEEFLREQDEKGGGGYEY